MNEGLIITKNKILYKYWDPEAEKPRYRIKNVEPKKLIYHLWDNVNLKDVTLGRIFEIVEPSVKLWSIILSERLLPLVTEMKQPWVVPKDRKLSDLLFLELYWDIPYDCKEKTIDIWPSFHAFGDDTEKEGIYYGVGFTPVNSMKNLVIKLKKDFKIYHDMMDKPSEKFGNKDFKLIELLKGIFWELTWYGTPQKRDETMKEVLNSVDEIKSREQKQELL